MTLIAFWLRAFVVTLLAELCVAVPLVGKREALSRRLLAVILAQVLSHPTVWFILPLLGMPRVPFLLVAETWAVLSEALLYRLIFSQLNARRALFVALIANGASLALGAMLRALGWV